MFGTSASKIKQLEMECLRHERMNMPKFARVNLEIQQEVKAFSVFYSEIYGDFPEDLIPYQRMKTYLVTYMKCTSSSLFCNALLNMLLSYPHPKKMVDDIFSESRIIWVL